MKTRTASTGISDTMRQKRAERPMIVATSRPETMFGDVAIAVHPDDERYKDMVGKKVILPLVGTGNSNHS